MKKWQYMTLLLIALVVAGVLFYVLNDEKGRVYGSTANPCYLSTKNSDDDRRHIENGKAFIIQCSEEKTSYIFDIASDTNLSLSEFVDKPIAVRGQLVKKPGKPGDIVCIKAPCPTPETRDFLRIDKIIPLTSSALSIISPKADDAWEAGSVQKIEWSGGGQKVDIYLIDKSLEGVGASVSVSDRIQNLDNQGFYEYRVPINLKGEYKISLNSDGKSVESGYFKINGGVAYENKSYGFAVKLPESWKGFTVAQKQWNGIIYDAQGNKTGTDKGPIISVNAPLSTGIKQDIPVMVFTLEEWHMVGSGAGSSPGEEPLPFMSVGAAPVPPTELGRNSKYVLALPARYNFAELPGTREVDDIVRDANNWFFFEP